jgi:hypothetical protein
LRGTNPSFLILVKRLLGVSTLGLASIGLSVAVVKSALIPEPLKWIAAAGSVVAALAIVILYQAHEPIRHRLLRPLSVVVVASFIALVILQSTLVIEISVNRIPATFLIGWKLTPSAASVLENCGDPAHLGGSIDPHAIFTCAGPDTIPVAYGWSYRVAYMIYALSYLALVASFAALVTIALMHETARRPSA